MPLITPILFYFKNHQYSFGVCIAFFFSLFFYSCNQNNKDNGDYSKGFKPIYDTVNNYYHLKKHQPQGVRYLDSAFKKLKHPFVHDRFRFYSFHFVYERKTAHNIKKALAYADSMLAVAKQSVTRHQFQVNYAEANFALGDAYFDLSQFSNAYKCFYQGYAIGKSELNNEILAEYTYRMGMVMFKQAHYLEAANYFKTSFNQSRAYKDDFRAFYQRQELLDNIGESYKNAGKTDSASVYLKKALNYIDANNARFNDVPNQLQIARGVIYGNQGDVALLTNNYNDAEQLLKQSIAINLKKGNDNKDAELTEIKLASLYFKLNKRADLLSLLKNLRIQLDSIPNNEAETSWNYLMSKYFEQEKDNDSALIYLKKYSILKDSVIKLANSLKRTDVTTQQANYDKQSEIDNLKNYNKKQLIYIYLAVLLSIMAVIIVSLVLRNLKRSKRDIKAVKALNDQVVHQKESLVHTLEELNKGGREKDRILRAVAHDLRNPLGGIASLSGAMADDDYTPEQLDMINLIKDTSYNSLELINEILEAANTTATTFSKELVDINALVSNSVELLRFKAADKQQTIILDLPERPSQLLISREKIWRVISNLITNAIKFSHNGCNINVSVKNYENGVEIAVKDNGIGIPDKLKQQVFNMFTDAKRTGTAGEKSFGLGLSICQQIVEKHNGKIWLQSDLEKGTTFYVFLPFAAEEVDLSPQL
ncbi:tetratricopeptide repeat-containing sensor histidine kinase [Mucilaginibacter sp. FT3.2]|uniref:tetratricopeptide repeat-containing sensor histidine kinase n=1 Tax=Mucilaginibacter sp. FT3.2 TaxID=2723090 RepID=UPI001622BCE1|nr:tetratricopeptide repeat-containing sensor histidine kinase [Mucilaginibacter sp. FT3.2]MBB6234372.1 signal transduction histidine kinase [Mucilaginibacter sp. FT3.2]